eukprot:TRINITY_DN3356_c0_g1_i1.p1 TRINITY_DN3356_c0_g1~~TRINITY_DN3356_c0_g1_i1.p1  ORF type:complete len:298 (+),score=63.92 TRINITY_DN3356_c0_g1_i1:64-957(+)
MCIRDRYQRRVHGDEVDPTSDLALATFVINSHIKNHPSNAAGRGVHFILEDVQGSQNKDVIPQYLLKKYIMYARQFIKPRLTEINKDKLTRFYQELRGESKNSGGFTVSVRHFESIIRMAEANARMHLRDYVRDDDIDLAISVMLESFIQSQKYSVARMIRKKFSSYITLREDTTSLLLHVLGKLVKEQVQYMQLLRNGQPMDEVKVPLEQFEASAKEIHVHDLTDFFNSEAFKRTYALRGRVIVKGLQIPATFCIFAFSTCQFLNIFVVVVFFFKLLIFTFFVGSCCAIIQCQRGV